MYTQFVNKSTPKFARKPAKGRIEMWIWAEATRSHRSWNWGNSSPGWNRVCYQVDCVYVHLSYEHKF